MGITAKLFLFTSDATIGDILLILIYLQYQLIESFRKEITISKALELELDLFFSFSFLFNYWCCPSGQCVYTAGLFFYIWKRIRKTFHLNTPHTLSLCSYIFCLTQMWFFYGCGLIKNQCKKICHVKTTFPEQWIVPGELLKKFHITQMLLQIFFFQQSGMVKSILM